MLFTKDHDCLQRILIIINSRIMFQACINQTMVNYQPESNKILWISKVAASHFRPHVIATASSPTLPQCHELLIILILLPSHQHYVSTNSWIQLQQLLTTTPRIITCLGKFNVPSSHSVRYGHNINFFKEGAEPPKNRIAKYFTPPYSHQQRDTNHLHSVSNPIILLST